MNRPDQPFLDAIFAKPKDDAPRLIYADWLDENREPERAEFIRVQCELAVIDGPAVTAGIYSAENCIMPECNCRDLRRRENELLEGHCYIWIPEFGTSGLWCENIENPPTPSERIGISFRRGFIDSVTCKSSDCLKHLDAILAEHPVQAVDVTTYIGWSGNGGPGNRPSLYGEPGSAERTQWNHYGQLRYECKQAITPRREEGDPITNVLDILMLEWPRIKTWKLTENVRQELSIFSTGRERLIRTIARSVSVPRAILHFTV